MVRGRKEDTFILLNGVHGHTCLWVTQENVLITVFSPNTVPHANLGKLKKDMQPDAYEEFVATHNCSITTLDLQDYESCRTSWLLLFKSSIQNRGLWYTNLIGDGDSKSYLEIVANDPYSGMTVQKLEFVGHFQKHVGARLRKLKSENKGKLSDGKLLSGKGRLTLILSAYHWLSWCKYNLIK